MRFVTALIHRVENLETANEFFCAALGFSSKTTESDWHLLDNGSITLRLTTQADVPFSTLHLELYCQQLAEETAALLTFPAITLLIEQHTINSFRVETRLQAPHNTLISLVKEFNEDELGIIPPLPCCLDWQESATICIQTLLTCTPLGFRALARQRVTEQAEVLAAERGEITVSLPDALQALAQVTPRFQHPTLFFALQAQHIDPKPYFKLPPL